ncbi:MAG: SIMPL domain-containing protein [Novosphingobium sp.]|nr:SIMPL domain-containing protein [Novosphingobium sp.]
MFRYAVPLFAAASLGALAVPAAAAEIQIAATGPVVELTVTESVKAKPDIATIATGVTTTAPTAVEAMRQNAAQMNSVIDRIKALGIRAEDIQTSGIGLNAQFDYDQQAQKQVFRGYQASNRVTVVLRRIDDAGKTLDALVAAGATDIGGPDFALEDNTAALAQARAAAVAKAAGQARDYAKMAGFSGVRLLEVNETQSSYAPPMPFVRMDAAMAKAPTPVEPGLVSNAVTITVKYEMTNG